MGSQIFMNYAEAVKVMGHHADWLQIQSVRDAFGVFSQGLLSIEGELWQTHRRVVQRAFFPANLKITAKVANEVASAMMKRIRAIKPARAGDDFVTLDIK
jgi:cytochrome P450